MARSRPLLTWSLALGALAALVAVVLFVLDEGDGEPEGPRTPPRLTERGPRPEPEPPRLPEPGAEPHRLSRREREQELTRGGQGLGVVGEPSYGVKARRLLQNSLQGDTPMGRPQAVNPTKTRRDPHGAAGIRTKREINETAGNGTGGAAR